MKEMGKNFVQHYAMFQIEIDDDILGEKEWTVTLSFGENGEHIHTEVVDDCGNIPTTTITHEGEEVDMVYQELFDFAENIAMVMHGCIIAKDEVKDANS